MPFISTGVEYGLHSLVYLVDEVLMNLPTDLRMKRAV
jgi:hypothetical protein